MSRTTNSKAYWASQGIGWGVYTALNLALLASSEQFSASAAALFAGLSVVGVLATHALRAFATAHGWKQLSLSALAWRVLGASVALSLITQVIGLVASLATGQFSWAQTSLLIFVFYVVQTAILYLLWQLIYFGVHAVNRSRRAEIERLASLAAAQAAELRALRSQLNPHFLFNSLNTLRALISESPSRAQESVTRLAALLRYSLAAQEAQTVPLARELEVVNDYLALEMLRFEERLTVVIDVPSDCLNVAVPVMLVQTLVENAVKHGIARSTSGGEVRVVARKEGAVLLLEVTNPMPAQPKAPVEGASVGLANTTERLRLLFGEGARFELITAGTMVTAKVRIPCP